MALQTWFSIAAGLVVAIAGEMACILFARGRASASHRSLAVLLGAIAVAHLANAVELLDESHALLWRAFAMVAELVQPALLLYVGLAFMSPVEGRHDSSVRWRARVIGILGLLLAACAVTGQVFERKVFEDGQVAIILASWGGLPYAFILTGMALGLAQLELVLRASREPVRHKLKFIVIGLGGLAGFQIYQASQMLLFPVWQAQHVLVGSVATAMALCLTAFGLGRTRLREVLVNTYISQQALFGSVTFIACGLYLLMVGAIGEWLRRSDQPLGVGFSIVVVFGALVGLAIVAFSKTVRADVRRFLNRNFYRSKHDYRAQWLQATEAFEQAASREAIIDRLLDFLIKTFHTTEISLWSFRETDRRFYLIRSMKIEKEPASLELFHPVIVQLLEKDEAVLIQETSLKQSTGSTSGDDPLIAAGVALCFPIRNQGRVTAFIALGRQLRGEAYGQDDCDLLRGISHHVGALLSHASLAEERRASAELEALHRFSVFCLHDLKNLAARLSLVAQNAETHGKDPAFQESAMRTVADTANKMTRLMSKLSLKSFEPMSMAMLESIDMSTLIDETVAPIRVKEHMRLYVSGVPVPPVMAVREQLHQVMLNLVLNAKQAIGEKGEISIMIEQSNDFVVVTVSDTGSGIPDSMLESLFRPLQSRKPGGLGVGLYQSKQIVEAHQGTIVVQSQEGKGTQVRIALPIYHAPATIETRNPLHVLN